MKPAVDKLTKSAAGLLAQLADQMRRQHQAR
jgi:hypothetical protein